MGPKKLHMSAMGTVHQRYAPIFVGIVEHLPRRYPRLHEMLHTCLAVINAPDGLSVLSVANPSRHRSAEGQWTSESASLHSCPSASPHAAPHTAPHTAPHAALEACLLRHSVLECRGLFLGLGAQGRSMQPQAIVCLNQRHGWGTSVPCH